MCGTGHKVLIVDDERVIADSLVAIFSANGHEARAAYSAEDAIEKMSVWRPELAIIDVCLPLMNGIELAVIIQASDPECHCTLFSGQASTWDLLEEARHEGHDFDILPKPVPPAELLSLANLLPNLSRNKGNA